MKVCILVSVCLMLIASPAISQEDTVASRLAQVEANNKAFEANINALLSTTTALKAGQDNTNQRLASVEAKLDALVKASGVKLASVSNWAGDPEFIGQPRAAIGSAWSSQVATTMGWSAMAGQSVCANGSCGSSSMGRGLFSLRGRR